MRSWLYKLTTGNFVMNKTLFTTFQNSHWLKFARCLCNAESRCLSSTDFRRWSITISHDKQNITPSLNIPVGYFLPQSWAVRLGRRWELAFFVEETAGIFTTNLSTSKFFYRFSQKESTFCWKADNFAYFHTYTSNKYQPFRLANLNKGHVCVTPIGDSLRTRLVPGPRHAK